MHMTPVGNSARGQDPLILTKNSSSKKNKENREGEKTSDTQTEENPSNY